MLAASLAAFCAGEDRWSFWECRARQLAGILKCAQSLLSQCKAKKCQRQVAVSVPVRPRWISLPEVADNKSLSLSTHEKDMN